MKKLINKNDDFNQDSFSFDEWPGMEQKSETNEIEPEQIAEETAEEKKNKTKINGMHCKNRQKYLQKSI
jgi:hypothetical protein